MHLRTTSPTRKVQGKRDQLPPDCPRDLSCASMGTLGRKVSFMRLGTWVLSSIGPVGEWKLEPTFLKFSRLFVARRKCCNTV